VLDEEKKAVKELERIVKEKKNDLLKTEAQEAIHFGVSGLGLFQPGTLNAEPFNPIILTSPSAFSDIAAAASTDYN
jgi:hypothetical protein